MTDAISDQISVLADHIRQQFPAKQIILFGSHARGRAQEDSDIDLCVITGPSGTRRLDLMRQLRRIIAPIVSVPVDILVYDQDEFDERAGNRSTLEYRIRTEGVRLYEQ